MIEIKYGLELSGALETARNGFYEVFVFKSAKYVALVLEESAIGHLRAALKCLIWVKENNNAKIVRLSGREIKMA